MAEYPLIAIDYACRYCSGQLAARYKEDSGLQYGWNSAGRLFPRCYWEGRSAQWNTRRIRSMAGQANKAYQLAYQDFMESEGE